MSMRPIRRRRWLALAGSGLWLVGRGLWGVFVPYRMHYFHLAVGVAFGALGILHIVIGLLKSPYPLELYAQPARPLVLWTVVFAIGAVVLGIARRPGIRATGDFAPSNAFS